LRVALLLLVASTLAACEPVQYVSNRRGNVDGRYFEFSSGGSYHPDGRGEWIVRLRGDAMWIARDRKGKITEYGTFKLADDEADKMWRLVKDADILSRPQTAREDGGENVRFRFSVMNPKKKKVTPHTIELRPDEVGAEDTLHALVVYQAKLIKKYTGRKPKF
jgi:hypothetical protein